ncbi:hypothetical protein L7F22_031884 [Adiantum nelumboides]|nr:hypothetical protein [Adiantum nelumboides]
MLLVFADLGLFQSPKSSQSQGASSPRCRGQCRGYRELKTEKNQSITSNYRGCLCSVLVIKRWNRGRDSGLLRILYLQAVLGRVLCRYAAQFPSYRLRTAWIQVLITEESSKRKSQGLSQYSAAYVTAGTADVPHDQKIGSDLQSADLEEGEHWVLHQPDISIINNQISHEVIQREEFFSNLSEGNIFLSESMKE